MDLLKRLVESIFGGSYPVTTTYGAPAARTGQPHYGVDVAAPWGTPLRSPQRGRVSDVKYDDTGGRQVEVEVASGLKVRYAHLSTVLVREGDEIDPGEVVGQVGTTGRVTGAHGHVEVRDRAGRFVNPVELVADPCPAGSVRDPRTGQCGYVGRGGFIPIGGEPERHPGIAGEPRSGSGGAYPPGSKEILEEEGRGAADVGGFFEGLGGALTGVVVGGVVVIVIVAVALMGLKNIAEA